MREVTDVIAALIPLVKYFISWSTVTTSGNILQVTASTKAVRITHDISNNLLIVGIIPHHYSDYYGDVSQFDLQDPRSIPATIRSVCRRVGKEMPAFESVDHILDNGIPKDVTDMWEACEK